MYQAMSCLPSAFSIPTTWSFTDFRLSRVRSASLNAAAVVAGLALAVLSVDGVGVVIVCLFRCSQQAGQKCLMFNWKASATSLDVVFMIFDPRDRARCGHPNLSRSHTRACAVDLFRLSR